MQVEDPPLRLFRNDHGAQPMARYGNPPTRLVSTNLPHGRPDLRQSFSRHSTDDFTLVAVDHPVPVPPRPSVNTSFSTSSVAQSDTLSPRSSGSTSPRQSSKRALTEALRLARTAVQLDSQNDDPIAAFRAYSRSVTLLNEVMEKVVSGDRDSEQRRRSGRLRNDVAREDEANRLRSIHDTYAERMRILAEMYTIPDHIPSSSSASTSSQPVIRPTPANSIILQQSPLEQQVDALIMLSEGEESTQSTPSTPTFSDRHYASTESLRAAAINHAVPSVASDFPQHPPSPRLRISPPPQPRVGAGGRVSVLPPARPPPTGPPPSRPRAASVLPLTASGSHPSHESLNEEESSSLPSSELVPDRNTIPDEDTSHLKSSAARSSEQRTDISAVYDTHPLPPLPEHSPGVSPLTPRLEMRIPASFDTPESTPRQRQSNVPYSRPFEDHRGVVPAGSDQATSSTVSQLVNPTTSEGTISQRRNKLPSQMARQYSLANNTPLSSSLTQSLLPGPPVVLLTAPPKQRDLNLFSNRSRAASQPGIRPSLVANYSAPTGGEGGIRSALRIPAPMTATPSQMATQTTRLSPLQTQGLSMGSPPFLTKQNNNLPTVPHSPLPPASPSDPVRKPYHLMSLLRLTMISKTGGYITRRLHVPHEVWSQGGAKLANLPEKVKVVEILSSALEELQMADTEFCGAGGVDGGVIGSPPPSREQFERWLAKLEDWSTICDGVVGNLGKKLGVGEGFAVKKSSAMTSWSTKFTRSLDKLTNGKNLDSPATYVTGLIRLFLQAQVLDRHSRALCLTSSVYSTVPSDSRAHLETKLKQSSEFFAAVVLTFVIRDLSLLLDKYAKKGGQWLSE